MKTKLREVVKATPEFKVGDFFQSGDGTIRQIVNGGEFSSRFAALNMETKTVHNESRTMEDLLKCYSRNDKVIPVEFDVVNNTLIFERV